MTRARAPLQSATLWLSAAAALLSAASVVGHLYDLPALLAFVPGRPKMQPATSALVALTAFGNALTQHSQQSRARRVSSAAVCFLVLSIALASGLEHLLGRNFGPWFGLPSPFTTVAFAALGAALVLDEVAPRAVAAREGLCLMAVFVAYTSLIGHAFGAGPLYRFGRSEVVGVALPTGLALVMLGAAALLARRESGVARLLSSPGPGGVLLRRLGLSALILGPLLGVLSHALASELRSVDSALLLALGNVLLVCLGLWLLATTAVPLERSHDAVVSSRARLHELFELAPEGIFMADLSGRYTDVNDAGCRLLDLPREQIVGKTIMDLIPAEDSARLWQTQQRMLQGQADVSEWQLQRRDGAFVPVEVTAKIFPDGRWQGFVRDITQRLELEHKHNEYRDFLQQVLESSTEYGIIAEDSERNIILWNEGAHRSYGYELGEVLGKASDFLVAPSALHDFRELHMRSVESGSAEGTVLALRKNGETFAASVMCTRRLEPRSGKASVLMIVRDVSPEQRYLAEQEFLARAGIELAGCLEYREALSRVTELATSFLGDMCAVSALKDGVPTRVAVHHRDPDKLERMRAILGRIPNATETHPLRAPPKTQAALVLPQRDAALISLIATDANEREVFEAIGLRAAMLIPLVARGQLSAVLAIGSCDAQRGFDERDLRLAEELARRAALALDNVQLFQQSRLQGAVTTNLAEGVVLVRARDATIVYANPRFEALLGYPPGELIGKPVHAINADQESLSAEQRAHEIIDELKRAGSWKGEILNVRKDGSTLWCASSISAFEHEEYGDVWIAVHTDITARKLLEEKNEQSLRDKEVLLREIHHRVKNNLQVISSLFALQRSRTTNDELKFLLDESRTRVESIALVHEQLYRSPELASINFDEYLRNLVSAIRASYGAERVRIEARADGVMLDVEEAVPAALLVCELVSNSLKHAFGAGPGNVWVRARRRDQGLCELEVKDDGRGMPADFDWKSSSSLGLRLVRALAWQLRGTVELERGQGTVFKVTFALRSSAAQAANRPAIPANGATLG